ncbi:MAG: hypothetical protein J1E41_04035 [Ruminococcus sp.]|nr:hypothetical protein [Ruminococcus sp.]
MKKLLAIVISSLIVCLSCVCVFAAGINSSEASVLSSMRTPANMKGNNVYVPSSYINQAEAYFNTIDMTQAQASKINGIISQGRSFLEKTGKSSLKELTASERQTLIGYASSAAAVLNLSAAAGSDNTGVKVITKNGDVIVDDSGSVIKTTGAQHSVAPFVAISVLAVMFSFAGAGVIYSRKKSFVYEEIK